MNAVRSHRQIRAPEKHFLHPKLRTKGTLLQTSMTVFVEVWVDEPLLLYPCSMHSSNETKARFSYLLFAIHAKDGHHVATVCAALV